MAFPTPQAIGRWRVRLLESHAAPVRVLSLLAPGRLRTGRGRWESSVSPGGPTSSGAWCLRSGDPCICSAGGPESETHETTHSISTWPGFVGKSGQGLSTYPPIRREGRHHDSGRSPPSRLAANPGPGPKQTAHGPASDRLPYSAECRLHLSATSSPSPSIPSLTPTAPTINLTLLTCKAGHVDPPLPVSVGLSTLNLPPLPTNPRTW